MMLEDELFDVFDIAELQLPTCIIGHDTGIGLCYFWNWKEGNSIAHGGAEGEAHGIARILWQQLERTIHSKTCIIEFFRGKNLR